MLRTGPREGLWVAVAGKGGSGKSTVAALLSRILARQGHRVLAIDSDPMPGLAVALGLEADVPVELSGFATQDEQGTWHLTADPEEIVERAARVAADGVRFLQFGVVETRTLAPLIGSIQALWAILHTWDAIGWTVVHDLPAGTRQSFSGWLGRARGALVVVEPSARSVLTGRRLSRLADTHGVRVGIVANKVRTAEDFEIIDRGLTGVPVLAQIPWDEAVDGADRTQITVPPIDPPTPAVLAVTALVDTLGFWLDGERETADDARGRCW